MSSDVETRVHFGPVYGRPVGSSMALCASALPEPGASRTMSRSLKMVTCADCDRIIQDRMNECPPVQREDIT